MKHLPLLPSLLAACLTFSSPLVATTALADGGQMGSGNGRTLGDEGGQMGSGNGRALGDASGGGMMGSGGRTGGANDGYAGSGGGRTGGDSDGYAGSGGGRTGGSDGYAGSGGGRSLDGGGLSTGSGGRTGGDVGSSSPIHFSARSLAGAGDATFIVGLSVTGSVPKRVLIRGVGPTLAKFGVGTALAHPQVRLFRGTLELARNAGWGDAEAGAIAEAATQVHAFPLSAGSKDAALVATLEPGVYTVQVSSTDGAIGVTLVEVYELK